MINCPICQTELKLKFPGRDYLTGDSFSVYQCPACRVGLTVPTLDGATADKYYKTKYFGKRKSFTESLINNERANSIERLNSSETRPILHIGCGNGSLLRILKDNGWQIAGTELAPAE